MANCLSWEIDEGGRTKAHAYAGCADGHEDFRSLCGRLLPTFADEAPLGLLSPPQVCSRCVRLSESHVCARAKGGEAR